MVDSTKRKFILSFLRCEVVAIIVCILSALGNAQAYNMGNGTINTCSGSFYDSGGAGGNYANNQNFTYTICPNASGQCARVTFTAFNIEANYDFLSIYNGPSSASPLIGTYTGNTNPGTITSTNGCLTFVFTSDISINSTGWAATISCVACNAGGGPCATNCAGAPPANDACSGAQNLGTLPVPAPCPSGVAAWATFNTTNLCATAEVPYVSVIGCQPGGNMANPAADVWYQFTITAPTLNVQISGLQIPQCAIYQGTNCNNMIPMGCAIGAAGNLTTTFGGLANGTYYMQVSGGSLTDRCAFTLQLQNNFDCQGCVIQSSLTVNPPPFNGTYQPGQTVNFCYTITDYNQASINWLHAVCPNFGPGWVPGSLVTVNPANCSGQGQWNYYNALITSTATGLVTGPGWFYDSPLGDANGGYPDGNPGDNFGDNNPNNSCDWTFCWNITTVPANQCVNGTSLNIAIDTYGDGESGSWTSFACNLDPITRFFATLACCTPPTVNVTNINCATGTASATATGTSNGPWTYVWKNAAGTTIQQSAAINTSNTINNLPAGTYTVIIVDNANCASQQTFTVTAPNSMTVTPSQTNILCNGGATGSATVNISGGTGPYTYSWAPSGGAGATANNLGAGTYTVTIHDNAGCVTTQQFTITQPTALTASASGANVNCNGGNNGSATVNAGGGTAPFTYSWSPSGGSGVTASNLTAGTYTVTVTDANGCTIPASYTVTQPPVVTAVMGAPTNVNCNGGNNGSATVTAGGGVSPYTYAWSPSGGSGATGTGLAAGSYTVTVTDGNGCSVNSNVNITQPTLVTANINASSNVLCNGGNTGSASVTAGGGTPGYTYAWTPSGGTGSAANNLTVGNYTVTITDTRGCTQTATVNITQPPALTASTTPTNVLCNGAATGSATVTPGGGTAGYTYSWTGGGGTGATASGLSAGSYTVTVTDANGCTTTANATITQPAAITSTTSSTPTNCGSSTGTATVNPSGGAGGFTYSWSPSGGNAATANNLAAGAYVVTITDANGCNTTANVAVSNNAGPTASIPASTNVSCNGGTNGTANANASGGTGPYSYSWTPSGGNGVNATGLSAGTYTVTILDANGCSASTNINITEPPAVTAAINNSTNVLCDNGTTGSATAVAGGGTPGYTYSWAPGGATGATASNLGAGSYTVTITDAGGCTNTASVTISQPTPVTATVPPVTNVLCNGGNTGSASVNAGGGTAPYNYSWSPSGGNGATASGLAAGNYTVTVTDANGCTSTANAAIAEPAVVTSAISASSNISCNGSNNGSATVNAGGGTGPYTYSWAPSGGTGVTESNLAAGNYTVTVTDANGCISNAPVTISEPTVLQSSTSGINVSCNGNANGSASVSPTGGTAGYTYVWTPSGGTGATANGLSGGTYHVTVTDANGCTATDSFVVVEPAVLTSSISSSTNALCNGAANGTASVLANGGTPALTYNWTPTGGTGASVSNLSAGAYTVTTTDANGCTTTTNVNIAEPSLVTLVTSSTDANCGSANGSASVVAAGGTAGYTYSWSSGGNGSTENNLPSGNVTVTVTDANGCSANSVVAVGQSPGVTATMSASTDVSCNGGANGTATIGVAGGTAPFTYVWSPSGGAAATASGLSAGNYSVTVTDVYGCNSTDNVVITEPPVLTSSAGPINILCNGAATGSSTVTPAGGTLPYSYLWSSGGTGATENNLTAGNYSVTVTDANGCTSVSNIAITEPALLTSSTNPADALCNGGNTGSATVTAGGGTVPYTYSWTSGGTGATENNLAAGNYSVTVTDGNGCTSIANVTIAEPVLLTSSTTPTDVLCNGNNTGSASVTAGGGTTPYSYSWSSGGSGLTENNLAAGNYTVTVTDGNGCTSVANVTIVQPALLTSSATPTDVLCNGNNTGSASVNAGGGITPYTYSWTSGGTGITENNLAAGNYSVTVTDGNGCSSVTNVTIAQPALLTSSITPTDVLCYGNTTGSASVAAGGGTAPFSYAWTSGGTGAIENNLAAGNYSVTITDGNGCTSVANVTIAEPAILTAVSSSTQSTCGSANGTVSVVAGGGNAPYTYSWTGGGTGSTVNNLSAGSYTVTVTDGNGCAQIANAVVADAPGPAATASVSANVLCNGGNTGSASVNAVGGTAPLIYSWTSGGTGTIENNLAAGNYTVTVTDANGCISVDNITITQPALMTNVNTSGDLLCNGDATGWATITVAGGTGAYTYNWTPGGIGTATNANIAAGNYSVIVTDANGCSVNAAYIISEPAVLSASMIATDVLCNGGNNGTASVTVNGGTSGYTYLWAPGGFITSSISNRPAGNYTATITDANGCSTTASASINEPVVLNSGVSTLADVLCNGGNTGSASVTVNGGVSPYAYNWSPSGGTASAAINLTAGNYTVNVTDANGCSTSTPVTISEPALLTSSANGTNVNCNGGTTGTASVNVIGGTAGYTYTWSPLGGNGTTANNLAAGNYTVNVVDLNGCTTSASVIVSEPTAVTSSTSNTIVSCNGGANGSATVAVNGGIAPYTYSWFPAGGTGASATNLSAGSYTVTITDGNGCVSTASATVTEPSALSSAANNTNSTCGNTNGTASVVANGGTAGYTYLWSPSGGNAATASGLAAGAYSVTVTDANGCTSVANTTVANTAGQTAIASVQQNVLCNAGNTGIGTVNVAGGTAPITYAWSPSGGSAATANNLTAGNYTITTTDANGCVSIDNITISQPAILSASANSTPALCNGATDGNASSTVNGGTTPYTYSWSGGGGTGATATNLSAGNYTVTITDGNGCITTANTTVAQPAVLTANANATQALCNGGSTGSASVVVNGGTAGYSYSWFPTGGTGNNANNLSSGSYIVTVTDANGCIQTAAANVTEPAPMTTNTNSTPALCGSTNGTASVTVNGGAGGYTYSWSPAGGTGATASGIGAGAFTVTITDANGCQTTDVANVSNTGGPTVTASVQQNVSCSGGNNGSGTVNAAGGTAPYTYAWSPAGGTGATSTTVPAGNYTVTVTDANGCISSDNITITEPSALAAQATPSSALCNGGNSGSASSLVAGGTAPFTYSWSGGGGTGATANNLAAGNYTLTVTDANGCITTATALVSQPAAISLIAGSTPALCNGGSSGSASVAVSGGTSGYTYSWFPSGGSAATATNLASGSYTVTVTDANGCTQTASANVADPVAMSANTNTTAASCGGSNGSATVAVSNGTAPYSYSWSSGGSSVTENNLTAGSYTVTITDANGCIATANANVTNSGGATVTASVQQNVLCNNGNTGSGTVNVVGGVGPFTYAWSPSGGNAVTATNLTAGNYTVTVTGSNGCISTDNITITEPAALASQASSTNATCNGSNDGSANVIVAGGTTPYTYSWTGGGGTSAAASNLIAGNYTVTVTDGNGCATTSSALVTQPAAITLSTSATAALCNGASTGSATATAGGGAGGFTYSWSPSGGNAATASNLSAGNYTVTITDANGCSTNASVVVTQPAAMTLSTNTIAATCGASNGSASATVGGGAAPYTYVWSPSGGVAATANNLMAGSYTVTVTDANGCSSNSTAAVSNAGGPSILASVGTNVNCNGASTGSASVNVNGGTGPFTYSWSPAGGTGTTANNLIAGTYTVSVTDANGCASTQTVTITEPSAMSLVTNSIATSCGASNGSATVNVSGGTGTYTYVWSPGGGNGSTANNLSGGAYTVTVTDGNGCISNAGVTVANNGGATTAIQSSTNVNCNGGNNGSATVSAAGGATPYTYSWSPSGGTNATANGLTAGNYTVTVTDATGCISAANVTITQPAAITASTTSTSATCGSSNGSASVNANGGTGVLTYIWSPSGGTNATANNLGVGSYTVTITDAGGCSITATAAVSNVGGPTITASVGTNVSCNGGNNGTASVNVSGGTGPFTYAWSPSGGTGTNATNLPAGTYTVSVADANGCASTQSINITQPAAINLSTSSVATSCGSANGSAAVVASGGTGSFTYSWAPSGGTSANAGNLIAGSYTVTVTDGNGCASNASVVVANNGGATTTLQSSNNVSCHGGNNGSAAVSVNGGATPYTYSWSPAGGSAASATGLTAGNYTVTVTDANGCISSAAVSISEPAALTSITSTVPASCGASNGSASVNANGGTGALTYQWSPAGGTGTTANNLSAGSYTVTISDANGCTTTSNASVSNIGGPTVTASVGTNVSCNNGSSGSASVNVTSGTGPFTYQWTPSGGTSTTASNLSSGNYAVTVTDANGCISTSSVTITQPAAITISTASTPSSCGNANGSAFVNASGGTGAFTYAWSPNGGTGISASNLIAGAYTVVVTDANGCTGNSNVSVTNVSGATSVMQSSVNVICNGGSNGSATVQTSGGTAPYSYSWTPIGGTGSTANNLPSGNYSVTVTDGGGCISNASVVITQPAAITATTSSTPASCGSANGSANVIAGGGTGVLTYVWSNGGGTSATAQNLTAGNYTVTVTDANGCSISASAAVSNVGGPTAVASVGNNVSCNGGNNGNASVNVSSGTGPFTYQWTPSGGTAVNASNLPAGNYTITVTDANGCITSESVTITQPASINLNTSSTPSNCGATNGSASVIAAGGTGTFTYSWSPGGAITSSITNVAAGGYTVTVTDGNGCISNVNVAVVNNGGATAAIQSSTNVSCNGGTNGSATVNATGGATPYQYSWSPNGGTAATATNLATGNYTVTVTDANGCISNANVFINQPVAITASTSSLPATCGTANGSATVNANGGTGVLTYVWTNGGGTSATASNLIAGNYSVTVTDINGCSLTVPAAVSNIGGPTATASVNNNVSCNGGSNGNASVNVSAGTGPFTYSWTPSGGTGSTASNLSAGNYTVLVTDVNGCISSQSITITQPTPVAATTSAVSATCGSNNGSASVFATGGAGGYTYSWSSGGNATTESNLAAGGYNVIVTDANGCAANVTINVNNTGGGTATLQSLTNVHCNGGADGTATVSMTGGTSPFTYAWLPAGGSAATGTGLSAGSYTVTVTDANGCITNLPVTINQPSPMGMVMSSTQAACGGVPNGTATTVVSGGTGPYSYLWAPGGGTTSTITGLFAGNYSVTVTDNGGCTGGNSVQVTSPSNVTLSMNATPAACFGGAEGTATVVVSGGTAPFTYNWNPGGETTSTITDLIAGGYAVTVTDASGCVSVMAVLVTQPSDVSISVTGTPTLCIGQQATISALASGGTGPYGYTWSNGNADPSQTVSPATSTVYSVIVTDANGCSPAAVNVPVDVYPPLNVSATSTSSICQGSTANISSVASGGNGGPYTYSWNNGAITSASATVSPATNTSYTIVINDGCSPAVQTTVNINVNPLPVVSFMPHEISGCTPVLVDFLDLSTVPPGSLYSWNLGDGSTSGESNPTHIYTVPGNYNVSLTIVTSAGCQGALTINQLVRVEALPTADFVMSTNETTVLNSTIDFTDKSTNTWSWYWDFGDSLGTSQEANPVYTYSNPGNYTIMLITQNQIGCIDTAYSTLRVKNDFAVYVPNTFTPNGDGVNDGFIPFGVGWATFSMVILDRWGLEIYHTDNPKKPWNGRYENDGRDCQSDVYIYKILITEESSKSHELVGHVTLVQ